MQSALTAYALMQRLLEQFEKAAARVCRAHGVSNLSSGALLSLVLIADRPGLRQHVLGDLVGQSRQAAWAWGDLLAAEDLISRTPDPNDKRAKILTLTERGRAVAEDLRTEFSATFGEADLDAVAEVLGRVRIRSPL